jgi:hypothetical protein
VSRASPIADSGRVTALVTSSDIGGVALVYVDDADAVGFVVDHVCVVTLGQIATPSARLLTGTAAGEGNGCRIDNHDGG